VLVDCVCVCLLSWDTKPSAWDEGRFLSLLLCTSSTSPSIVPARRVDGKAARESAAEAHGMPGGQGRGRIANYLVQFHQCRLLSHQVHSSGTLWWKPNYRIQLKLIVSYSYNKADFGHTKSIPMAASMES
jgi:hypothetical protein